MTNNSGNWLSTLMNILQALFKRPGGGTPQPAPSVPADNTSELARIVTSRVLLVIYDPIMDPVTGQKLTQKMNWGNPDTLSNEFIADILALSNGLARYQIVDRVELNEFPALADNNFRYDPELGGYIFNLSTKGLQAGTYNLTFSVSGDPVIHSAEFRVR